MEYRAGPKEYGLQLREKQKAKRYYGVLETRFRNYFEKASKLEGMAGPNLLSLASVALTTSFTAWGWQKAAKRRASLCFMGI